MVNFVLKNVTTAGSAILGSDGSLTQSCLIVIEIQGIKKSGKTLNDLIDFNVPNDIMSGKNEPLTFAWDYIKNVLVPNYIKDFYSEL